MAKQQASNKLLVDVFEKDKKYFANVDFSNSQHSLGPSTSRDEIYHLIFSFISDLRLVAEIHQAERKSSAKEK